VFPPSKDRLEPFQRLEGLSAGLPNDEERLSMLCTSISIWCADVTAPQVEALTETLKTLIGSNGGSVSKVEAWGLKSLAFRIKKNRKAYSR